MSTPTNFNQPTPPSNFGPGNGGGDNSKRMLTMAGVAIALLLGAVIFLMVSKYKTSQQLEATTTELTNERDAMAKLNATYEETVAQLEAEKGKNAELDATINKQLEELNANKAQVEQLIKEKKDYRAALANMERKQKEYLVQIDELKVKVGLLTEENTKLSSENENLSTTLTDTKTRLEEESTAKAALISEKTQLETERVGLSKKVDIASAIKVSNIEVKTVSVSSSGKEREKSRAKKVDKIKICFQTEANEVVPAGQEVFYLRVIDPTGAPLAIESLGSGIERDKKADAEFRYTTTATCEYSNSETNVCGYWQPGQDFIKGNYNVEIFNKGYLVGKGTFKLK